MPYDYERDAKPLVDLATKGAKVGCVLYCIIVAVPLIFAATVFITLLAYAAGK